MQDKEPSFEELVNTLPGRILPKRYRIDNLLSLNPCTALFRAYYEPAEKVVNLRLFKTNLEEKEYHYKRFQQEIKKLSSLEHKNIAETLDYGILSEGFPFIIQENVEGATLEDILEKQNIIETDQCLLIFSQLACALHYAHDHGVLHETLKPSHIILKLERNDTITIKVNSFSLLSLHTKLGTRLQTFNSKVELIGNAAYMSPELCQGKEIDGRSDIYSLGSIFYECISGECLFNTRDPESILKIQTEIYPLQFKQLSENPNLPKKIITIIEKCLAKDPVQRYQFAKDIQSDLESNTNQIEQEETTNISLTMIKAQERVKESIGLPIKQFILITIFISAFTLLIFIGLRATEYASEFANSGAWKNNLSTGQQLLREGKIDEALTHLKESFAESKKFKGLDLRQAQSLNALSKGMLAIGHKEAVEKLLYEALRIENHFSNLDKLTKIETLRLLAETQLSENKALEAIDNATTAYNTVKDLRTTEPSAFLQCSNTLLKAYIAKAEFLRADSILSEIQKINNNNNILDIETLSSIEESKGLLALARGQYEEAAKYLNSVLGQRQEKTGLGSPASLETMQNICNLFICEKKFDKAITILSNIIEIQKNSLPEGSPRLADLFIKLGELYELSGKDEEAEKNYRLALDYAEKIWGQRNPGMIPYINTLAKFLRKNSRVSASEVYESELNEIEQIKRTKIKTDTNSEH